jgi:hypothetical protein
MGNEISSNAARAIPEIRNDAGPCVSTTMQTVLELPPYKLARFLEAESQQPDGGLAPEILDALASQSPTHAALALADLCGLRMHENFRGNRAAVKDELCGMLPRCLSLAEIRDAMLTVPTLDAITCRRELFKMTGFEAFDATAAAMYAIMGDRSMPTQIEGAGRFLTRVSSASPEMPHQHFSRMSKETCEPLTAQPLLSPANAALLTEFGSHIAPTLFPPERYGYGALANELEFVPFEEKEDVWGIRAPWGESPDLPSSRCHQCADSAPAARSFFVSRGIPADVYVMSLGNLYHNVCIAFFQEQRADGPKCVPVLVDASPYNGFYSVEQGERDTSVFFNNALGTHGVVGQRALPLAFVGGDRLHVSNAGLAPWCCEELPSGRGRIIGFGGVMASQKEASWLSERGTPEYYGNGIRAPRPELSLYVMPHSGNELEALRTWSGPFLSVVFYQDSGRAVACNDWTGSAPKDESAVQLRAQLIAELEPLAQRHLADVHAMVKRSGYSLAERVFGQMGTLRTLK